ncbi:restin homolog [Drosophila nasuta]|uniref:restin homolog n=1 Tax=Drosophila nasuta TaxID=42062 RepID=UPI00295E8DF3|nr:restin homolog [Drosophila nasuta]
MSEAQNREQKLQKDLAKLQLEQQQQSRDNEVAMKELQERLEITNTELQHKEQLARENEQKIADLKTLVEAIRVANANLSAKNAELSTVLEVLQAEKNETMQSFELFEMEADMNAGRLIEKLHGMKQELEQTHSALKLEKSSSKQLQGQLQELQQTDQNFQGTAVEVAEQLRQLNQSNGELQETMQQKQYDKKRKQVYDYKEGDFVAVKRTQFFAGKKLQNNYLGPYEVIEVKRNGRFEIRKAAQTEGPNITNTSSDNMKLWQYVGYNDDCLSSGTDDAYQDGRM